MSTEIRWQEPPATGNNRWAPVMDELKRNPGKWALLLTEVTSGNGAQFRNRGFEVRAISKGRGYQPGKVDIYVRWPGATA